MSCSNSNPGQIDNFHTVTFDSNGGSPVASQQIAHGEKIAKPNDPSKLGYDFVNWTYQGEEWSFIGYVVTSDMTLDANWELITYSITYKYNGGDVILYNPKTYTVLDNITLIEPRKSGFQFLGWFDESDRKITHVGQDVVGDLVLSAKWNANLNSLTITSNDETKGTVSVVSGSGYSLESITVQANPVGDSVFIGWYDGETRLSTEPTYSFVMPREDYSFSAVFFSKEENEQYEAWKLTHGVTPVFDNEMKTVQYGLYPQTYVKDSDLVDALNQMEPTGPNGWYLYNGEYYTKATAKKGIQTKFNDFETIVGGDTYWFKCEPITWNILSNDESGYLLLSSFLLEPQKYNSSTWAGYQTIGGERVYANNYEKSSVRKYLNNEFLQTAFKFEDKYIQTTLVKNGGTTTESDTNMHACKNTNDKVFLPSYKDCLNKNYGFIETTGQSQTRGCKTTDWARTLGAYTDLDNTTSPSNYQNGSYWTRSPTDTYNVIEVWSINSNGDISESTPISEKISIRPCIVISM